MENNLEKARKLASLLRLPKDYQDAAFVVLEEIQGLNDKLERTVSVMEGYQPEEIAPVLTELVASISSFRDLVQDKNIDFTPLSDMLKKILEQVSIKQKFPDDRTDELLSAIKNLSKSFKFPEIKVEKTVIDLSGVEERLDKLNKKESPSFPEIEIPEIPQNDRGQVPVKLDFDDIEQISKGVGKNIKVSGGGGGMPSDVAQSIVGTLHNYKLNHKSTSGTTTYLGFEERGGNWYIQKIDKSSDPVAFTYSKGSSDYTTNWSNRASLTYGTYGATF